MSGPGACESLEGSEHWLCVGAWSEVRTAGWHGARSWHAEELGFYLECDGKLPDDFIQGDFTILFMF